MSGDPGHSKFLMNLQQLGTLCKEHGKDALFTDYLLSIPTGNTVAQIKTDQNPSCQHPRTFGREFSQKKHEIPRKDNRNNNETVSGDAKKVRINARDEVCMKGKVEENQSRLCMFCKKNRVHINNHYLKVHKLDINVWVRNLKERNRRNAFICPQCNKDYRNSTAFREHLSNYHNIHLDKNRRRLKKKDAQEQEDMPAKGNNGDRGRVGAGWSVKKITPVQEEGNESNDEEREIQRGVSQGDETMNDRDYLFWLTQGASASTSQGSQKQRASNQQSQNQRASNQQSQNQRASNQQPQNQRDSNQQSQNQRASNQQSQNQRDSNQQSQNKRDANQQPQNHRSDSRRQNQDQTTSSRVPQNTARTHQPTGESARPQTPEACRQASQDGPNLKELLLARLPMNSTDYIEKLPGPLVIEEKIRRYRFQCPECRNTYVSQENWYKHYTSMHIKRDPDEKLAQIVESPINIIGNHIVRNNYANDCKCKAVKNLDEHTNSNINSDNTNTNNNGTVHNDNLVDDNVSEAAEDYYECDECECYFTDERKYNDHAIMHGFQVICKTCNEHFCFEDIRDHVKDCRPEKEKESAKKKASKNTTRRKVEKVFKCNKCNEKFDSKIEAWKHIRIHSREFKHLIESIQPGPHDDVNENVEDVLTEKDILYICEACDIATASYDVAVEHSQKHIVADEQFTVVNCDTCQLKFEPVCHEKHFVEHYKRNDVTKDSFKHLKYKYHLLLTNEWLNFFDMEKDAVDKIVSGSIFAATRGVRMRVVEGNLSFTNTLYQCRQCNNFIEASTVLHHAQNFDTCVRIRSSFPCNVCDRSFNTKTACDNHKATHTDNEIFRIVVFNADSDRGFNYKLKNN